MSSEKDGSFGKCADTSPSERANELPKSNTPMDDLLGIWKKKKKKKKKMQLSLSDGTKYNSTKTEPGTKDWS